MSLAEFLTMIIFFALLTAWTCGCATTQTNPEQMYVVSSERFEIVIKWIDGKCTASLNGDQGWTCK